jgi:type III secretory pathway lipoprotein EscJ
MRQKVQVAVAGDIDEAEGMQAILRAAGIETEFETGMDEGLTLMVDEDDLDAAQEALEALTEPDQLIGEP